jgi:RNA polymerase sigma-70 factor (ECF subfamily)
LSAGRERRYGRALSVATSQEAVLVAAVRAGDGRAFAELIDTYGAGMRRFALSIVHDPAVADEVVQEAWLGILRNLDGFEGRASLKTWIFRIVANTANTRAERESRSIPFSAFADETVREDPSVDPSRFRNPRFLGGWTTFPEPWDQLEARETRGVIAGAIEQLPPAQRLVISLRDVEGWSADEVCNVLELSESNQRVLLHRARSKVRTALERHLEAT